MSWCKRPPVLPVQLSALTDDDLPEGWQRTTEPESRSLVKELRREVGRRHVLFREVAIPLAWQPGEDEVLFFVAASAFQLAQVHLTWSREANSEWPFTRTFRSLDEWMVEERLAK